MLDPRAARDGRAFGLPAVRATMPSRGATSVYISFIASITITGVAFGDDLSRDDEETRDEARHPRPLERVAG